MQTSSLPLIVASALLATACGQSTMPTSPTALPGTTGANGVVTASAGSTSITALKEGGSRTISGSGGNSGSGSGSGSSNSGSDDRRGSTSGPGSGTTSGAGQSGTGSSGPSSGPSAPGTSTPGTTASEDRDHGQPEIQAEGLVTLTAGTCPALTITVGARVFTTTALTDFQRGDCLRVVPGAQVHVSGRLVAGLLTASVVRVQGRVPDGPDHDLHADTASPDDDMDDDVVPPPPAVPPTPAPTPAPSPTPSPTPTV